MSISILKKKVKVDDKFLTIELPDEFKGEEVEITVRLKQNIEKEILADQIKIDTSKWKFNREEIYARLYTEDMQDGQIIEVD
jgi:hypothetical protein